MWRRDVAQEKLALPRVCGVWEVVGEFGHGGGRVDVQDEHFQPASVTSASRSSIARALWRVPSSGTRILTSCSRGRAWGGTTTTGVLTRVMTSSVVCPAG